METVNNQESIQPQEKENEENFKFSQSIENGISGLINFTFLFIKTFWLLTVKRKKIAATLPTLDSSNEIVKPFTFIALASLPGSIYFQAATIAFKEGKLDFYSVSSHIEKIVSQGFSITTIILTSLPIIFVVVFAGYFLSKRISRKQKERKIVLYATCYSVGYAILFLAFAGIIPLILRSFIPSEVPVVAGLVLKNVPLPFWAKYSGLPFSLFGLISAGHILSVFLLNIGNGKSKLVIRIKYYFIGWLLVYMSMLAVGVFTYVEPAKIIGASHKKNKPGLKNLSCRGRSLDIDSSGHLLWYFVIKNDSDETIYLTRQNTRLWFENWKPFRIDVDIDDWSAGSNSVLEIQPKTRAWLKISGVVSDQFVEHVKHQQSIVSGSDKMPRLKCVIFNAVDHKNLLFNAQDYNFPEKQKPIPIVRYKRTQKKPASVSGRTQKAMPAKPKRKIK